MTGRHFSVATGATVSITGLAPENCGMMTGHFAEAVFRGIIFLRENRRERYCRENGVCADFRPNLFDNLVVRSITRRAPLSRTGRAYGRRTSVRRPKCHPAAGLPLPVPSRGTARKPLFCKRPREGLSSTSAQTWPH